MSGGWTVHGDAAALEDTTVNVTLIGPTVLAAFVSVSVMAPVTLPDAGRLPSNLIATLSAALGNGVRITSNDIRGSNPGDPAAIWLNAGNIFYAEPANYTSSGGTLVGAQAITATFKKANEIEAGHLDEVDAAIRAPR